MSFGSMYAVDFVPVVSSPPVVSAQRAYPSIECNASCASLILTMVEDVLPNIDEEPDLLADRRSTSSLEKSIAHPLQLAVEAPATAKRKKTTLLTKMKKFIELRR
jgi:hypothetical protein